MAEQILIFATGERTDSAFTGVCPIQLSTIWIFFISFFFLSNQKSPLFLAAQAGQLLAVNALVAAKADLKKRNV
jgi:hypothetical protein